jgi:hypothetical protein
MAAGAVVCLGLAACGEKPQTLAHRTSDGRAFEGPATAYTAAGWKPGDAAGWEAQMRTRSLGQDDYVRAPAR